jgi:hypothetical protein
MRLREMIFAFLAASLTAAVVVVFMHAIFQDSLNDTRGFLVAVGVTWAVISLVALAPAFIAITYADSRSVRSVWYYILCGAGAALFFILVHLLVAAVSLRSSAPILGALVQLGIPGMVGGLVFWALAGRKAGAALPKATMDQ